MLPYPQFDPIAIDLTRFGVPLAIHWYGITYLVGFALFLWLANRRIRHPQFAATGWARRDVEDVLFYGVVGTVIGGRLGYVIFYKLSEYLAEPLQILAVWKGGMSFHGGLIGVIIGMALFARSRMRPFFDVADLVAPCVPTGFAAVRFGNFINGELWGRPADPTLPWSMVFPQGGPVARHPSQIYQMLLEGLLLFVVLWIYGRKTRRLGEVSALFLIGYGVLRFVAECFRQPDSFLPLDRQPLGLSQGQWLCVPMVLAGIVIWVWARRRPVPPMLAPQPTR